MKCSGKFGISKKQKQASERLKKNAEKGVRDDIKQFLSGEQDYEGSREDFIRDLSDEWNIDKDRVEEILHEESKKHPRAFNNGKNISDEQRTKNVEELRKKYQEYLKQYDYDKEKPEGAKFMSMLEESGVKGIGQEDEKFKPRAKGAKTFEEHGIRATEKAKKAFSDYLRDAHGTDDLDIITTGTEKDPSDIYKEFRNETIKAVSQARMYTKNMDDAYKKAFDKYKKKHPNTKLNLKDFINMNEE